MSNDSGNLAGEDARVVAPQRCLEFGAYRLDTAETLLFQGDTQIPLPPKALAVLLTLVESAGRLVKREELMERVWSGTAVEEGNLTVHISTLRKALGDGYIETIPRRGYRFTAEVRNASGPAACSGAEAPPEGGTVTGDGQEDGGRGSATGGGGVRLAGLEASSPGRTGSKSRKPLILTAVAVGALLLVALLAARQASRRQANTSTPIRSVAVLPFEPIGAAASDKELGAVMADAVINKLGHLPQLQIRSTSAILKYQDRGLSPLEVGRLERTDAVLVGKIQKSEDRTRVTVQLVRVRDGDALWSETFDEHSTDILRVQDLISQQVVQSLALELSGENKKRFAKHYTNDLDAYRLYLQGRHYSNQYTESGARRAISLFQEAITRDPNYALAYTGIADTYWGLSNLHLPPKEAMPLARTATIRALEIDNTLAEAHLSLALVKFRYDWEWAESERSFLRAIELNPRYAFAREQYGLFLAAMGRFEEAVTQERTAQELDPHSTSALLSLGDVLYYARRYDQSIEQHRRIIEIEPDYYLAHFYAGNAHAQKGELPEAIAEFQRARQIDQASMVLAGLGHAYAVSGQEKKAREMLKELRALSQQRWVSPYYVALVYIGLGEKELALEWLWKAYDERGEEVAFLKVEPKFDSLRSDPEFISLLQRVKLVD